jgi:hypothetical protein
MLVGSCLCGAVAYEADPPAGRFFICYCSRCRKASGSGHGANLYVGPDAFRWTRGERDVRRYDLPQARSFSTGFCTHCGSPVPHATRSGREIVIPAGSLDVDPSELPRAEHAHRESRTAWDARATGDATND